MSSSIIKKTAISIAMLFLIVVALKSYFSKSHKTENNKSQSVDLTTNIAISDSHIGKSKSSLKNKSENPDHKTAEAWLADPLFKSLSADIRIDYFCRQLVLSSFSNEALKLIDAEKDPVKRGYLIAAVADEWSKMDPIACYAWAIELKDQNQKVSALQSCITNVARAGNTELAFRLLDDIPIGSIKDSVLCSSIVELIKLDRARVVERLANISSLDHIRFASKILASSFVDTDDLDGVREHWDTLPYGKLRDLFGEAVVTSLVERDPFLGLDWIKKNAEKGESAEMLDMVAVAFAVMAPEQGLREASAGLDPTESSRFIKCLSIAWGARNPEDAANFLNDSLATNGYDSNTNLLTGVVTGMIQTDYDKTFKMVETISDPRARAKAETVAIQSLSALDPKAASEYLGGLSWVSSLESGPLFGAVASRWLSRDPMAASNWIGKLPAGWGKDKAVESLVHNIVSVDKDYQMAGSWAAQIGDTNLRAAVMSKIVKETPNRK